MIQTERNLHLHSHPATETLKAYALCEEISGNKMHSDLQLDKSAIPSLSSHVMETSEHGHKENTHMKTVVGTGAKPEQESSPRLHIGRIWFFLFLALFWGHYGVAPITDFVADDWSFCAYGVGNTASEIVWTTIGDYYRPLHILTCRLSFFWAGDRPWVIAGVRILLHGGVLAVFLCLLRRLFMREEALWIGGALYVFLPLLYEEFNWGTHNVLLYYPMAMMGAFLLWLSWLETGKGWWKLTLSWLLYLPCLGIYENCTPLCLMFPVSGLLFARGGRWKWSLVHVGLAALYVVYRYSHGFGIGVPVVTADYYSEGEGLSVVAMLQNARTILSWWCGGMMAKSFLGGCEAFATLKPKWQFAFVAGSVVLLAVLWKVARRAGKATEPSPERGRMAKNLFLGLLWMALAYSPHLLFSVGSRHNLLPIFGAGIVASAVCSLWRPRAPAWVWCGIGLLCLIANAGNAIAWRDAGTFCRRIYRHLEATQEEWEGKELVLFDTVSLRERQTPGILGLRSNTEDTWAEYHNAILLRGFVGNGMLKMCMPNPPQGIQDTEHGARVENGILYWHDRYNPSVSHETPMDRVFRVDCLAVATREAP